MREIEKKILSSFPNSFINTYGEFIAHKRASEYFILANCSDDEDIKCKVLEWFSRGAFKTEPYRRRDLNDKFHKFMLDGINTFLETNFTSNEIEDVYMYLGNRVNHELSIKFVRSGYNMELLKGVE